MTYALSRCFMVIGFCPPPLSRIVVIGKLTGMTAAGTAQIRGHDGKRKRAAPKKKVVATV